eukprot:1815823-Prorocentrum_lima.AAC.1
MPSDPRQEAAERATQLSRFLPSCLTVASRSSLVERMAVWRSSLRRHQAEIKGLVDCLCYCTLPMGVAYCLMSA